MSRLKLGITLGLLTCTAAAVAAVAEPMAHKMGEARITTRAEAQTGAEALFARLDGNKDGKLDAADRAAHMGKMFDHLDANHDGSISRDEFISAHSRMRPGGGMAPGAEMAGPGMGGPGMGGPGMGHMGGMKMRMGAMGLVMAIVHEADPQRTGTVTHDGFTAAALRLFDKADTNHDGKLSPEERRAAHRMMGGGQHRGMRGMKGMGDHDHDGGDKPMSGH